MTKKITDILFCGTGGQGVLKAAEICAVAAMKSGLHAKKTEVHGMAQRGGSVESHVRYGKRVFSPLTITGHVDFLVPFDRSEADKMAVELSKTGINLIKYLDISEKTLENRFFLNTFMVGALSRYLDIAEEHWIEAIKTVFKGKHTDENIRIFLEGRSTRI